MNDDEQIGYVAAIAELERILLELEGDTVDVDRLAGQVKRAAVLIDVCRQRITAARLEVESVVDDLERDR